MACKQWQETWIAHLYGELSADEQTALNDHLARCASCTETMRELGDARRLLGESAPAVPAVPRVVVLRPRPAWSPAWAFATGVAAATIVFFIGTLAATRGAQTQLAVQPDVSRTGGEQVATVRGVDHAVLTSETMVTREELDQELERVSRRFRRERAEDLDYLVRWLAASEQRTGTFMDRTEEALTYLALRGDPRVRER